MSKDKYRCGMALFVVLLLTVLVCGCLSTSDVEEVATGGLVVVIDGSNADHPLHRPEQGGSGVYDRRKTHQPAVRYPVWRLSVQRTRLGEPPAGRHGNALWCGFDCLELITFNRQRLFINQLQHLIQQQSAMRISLIL